MHSPDYQVQYAMVNGTLKMLHIYEDVFIIYFNSMVSYFIKIFEVNKLSKSKRGIDFWLHTLMTLGANPTDLVNKIMTGELSNDSEENNLIEEVSGERVDIENLASLNKKQIIYVAEGYIDDEWNQYQILCPRCSSDRIAQAGSKNGDIKFKCRNKDCNKKYFYLTSFVNSRVEEIVKPVAILLVKNYFPQRKIPQICGVTPTTIKNWIKEYDKMSSEEKAAFWGISGVECNGFLDWLDTF